MVMSVVSNLEFEDIKKMVEDKFVGLMPSDKKKKNKPVKAEYCPATNIVCAEKNPAVKTVGVRIIYGAHQTEKEANLYALLEDFIFNGFSGKLLSKLRSENGLVYTANYSPVLLPNNLCFKCIDATTSKKHVNRVFDVVGEVIEEVVKKGMSKKDFQDFQDMVASMEERRSGIKTINPLTLLDRYVDDREIFFNNQLHSVKNLTLPEINSYLKKVYKNANVIIDISGDFNEKKMYSVQEIEEKLHCKKSKVLYNDETNMFIFPDNYKIIRDKIPDKYIDNLEEKGHLGFVKGNCFTDNIAKQIQKMVAKVQKEIGEIPEDSVLIVEEGELKVVKKKDLYEENDEQGKDKKKKAGSKKSSIEENSIEIVEEENTDTEELE